LALPSEQQRVHSFAFSPDGKTLATGGSDSTILLWRVSDIYAGDADAKNANLETLWADLGSDDLTKAYRAIGMLANRAKDSLPLLRERVRPKVPSKAEVIARLLEELDNENFAVRERASKELGPLADVARATLEKVLANPPSLEVGRRVSRILDSLSSP